MIADWWRSVRVCCVEQDEIFEDFLDLDDDLELNVHLDLSQDFGIEVVGSDITEIIISDDVSEVRCSPGLPMTLLGT